MPLMPKRVKYRKSQRGSRKGLLRAIYESILASSDTNARARVDYEHAD